MNKALTYLIGTIIVGLLIIFALGYLLPDKEYPTVEYHLFEFTEIDGIWFFDWQQGNTVYNIGLRNNPYEVEDVVIRGRLNESFVERDHVYITFDPIQGEHTQNFTILTLAATELSQNMAKGIGIRPRSACMRNTSDCVGIPIVTCESNESVIMLTDVGEAGIVLKEDCIILRGAGMELLRAVDRLLYQWYGIL